jgi:hypothetical protein
LLAQQSCDDIWDGLFAVAAERSTDQSGLSPYWVYPVDGGAHIERHIPSLPHSREETQLPALRNSLALYRMVFGQPRQDDLIEFLSKQLGPKAVAESLDLLRIDLSPKVAAPRPVEISSKCVCESMRRDLPLDDSFPAI